MTALSDIKKIIIENDTDKELLESLYPIKHKLEKKAADRILNRGATALGDLTPDLLHIVEDLFDITIAKDYEGDGLLLLIHGTKGMVDRAKPGDSLFQSMKELSLQLKRTASRIDKVFPA